MELFDQIIAWIMGNLMTTATMVGMVLEFIFRLTPTAKPWSILLVVKSVIEKVSGALALINSYLDKVIPQNIK